MKWKKLLSIALGLGILIYLVPLKLRSDDLGKANKYYEKYDYQYAIKIYERLMAEKPMLEIALKLANCHRLTNNTLEAEKAYAKVLTFPGFDPINYLYYANALKQNGKFEEAKLIYLTYAEREPSKSDEAVKMANSCDAARIWLDNPDMTIQLVNEGGFNSENSDFSPIAYDNGFLFVSDREFLKPHYNKDNKSPKVYGWTGNPYLKLYQAVNENEVLDGKLKLSLMPEEINDKYNSGPATLSSDGRVLYFTKAGFIDGANYRRSKDSVMKNTIYYSVKQTGGTWSPAIAFPYNNPLNYSIQHPALSPDNKTLYFASDMPGTMGGTDIFYSENTGAGWSKPVNCGPNINTKEDEVFPYLRRDGKLFFSSKGHINMGGLDIFSSAGAKNDWTDAENLKSPMNSTKDDFGVFYFQDNLTGFISSNRPGGLGKDDIYLFSKRSKEKFFAIEGHVVMKDSGAPLENIKIVLVNKSTGKEITTTSAADGSFKFDLEKNTDYVVRGDLEKYFSRQQGEITTKGALESTIYNVKFEVEKGEEAFLVRMNNIYYDFDKSTIRKDAEPELNKVLNFMNATPYVKVEMRSHTDSRGKADYNMELSQRRANSAEKYLLDKGANSNRLSAQGFGETLLLNKCADGVKCTDEEHQLNRRTAFKVVKINTKLAFVPNYFIMPLLTGSLIVKTK
ncbi:MAG: OmpA family protein [Pelobium sp.]